MKGGHIAAVILAILFVACCVFAFIGGYIVARSDLKPAIALGAAREQQQREAIVSLNNALGAAEGRVERIRSGLEEAANIVVTITDRQQRIAVLVDAIDRAILEAGE